MLQSTNKFVRQLGLTLVETIVAILLITSGVIGIAAIYAQQQNIARGGRLHQRATELAKQMAADIARESNPKLNFETTLGVTCSSEPVESDKKANQNESANTANLVACWQDAVEQELTNGAAYISLDRNTIPAQYVIIVSWSEPRSGAASYVLRVAQGSNATNGNTPATTARSGAARVAG